MAAFSSLTPLVRTALAGAFLALPADAAAQWRRPTAVQLVIAEHWRTVSADSASLSTLRAASSEIGGGTIVRAAIDAARNPDRPFEVRFAALNLLAHAVSPGSSVPEDWLKRLADEPEPECEASTGWTPGDTLRVCYDLTRGRITTTVSHPRHELATTTEPPLRDTIRTVLRTLARSDPDRRVRLVASVLDDDLGPVEDPLGLRSCPVTAGEGGICRGAPLPSAALRWTTIGPGAALDTLLKASQEVRDRRIQALLKTVTLDKRRPGLVRRAAMEALATLAHPRMYALRPRGWDKFAGPSDAPGCVERDWYAHRTIQSEGVVPMRANSRFEIVVFLEGIGRSKAAPEIRKQGARLAGCLWSLSTAYPTPGP